MEGAYLLIEDEYWDDARRFCIVLGKSEEEILKKMDAKMVDAFYSDIAFEVSEEKLAELFGTELASEINGTRLTLEKFPLFNFSE